jgi:hypothetical protein
MITVTASQIDRLQAARDDGFVTARLGLLRDRSGHGGADDALHAASLALLRAARGHGLAQTDDLIAFITLGLVHGPHFDDHPPFRAILTDPRWSARQRLSALLHHSDPADWRALAAASTPARTLEPPHV